MAAAVSDVSRYASEGLGTFLLVFVIGLNLTTGASDPGLAVFGPTAIGFALMVLMYAFGPISGAHLNPAVTLAVVLQEKMSKEDGLKYLIAQCSGGALAGLSTGFLASFGEASQGAEAIGPVKAEFAVGAPLVEFLFTFLLCFVFLNVAVCNEQANNFYGAAVGFVVIAASGAKCVSGAALNPAVSLGVFFMGPNAHFFYLPVYAAVQLAGGFAAVTALHIVRPSTKKTGEEGAEVGAITKLAYALEAKFDPEDTAEFLGTFFIGLTFSLNSIADSSAGKANPAVGWSVAACYICLIFSLADVSGAVFNPALTLAFCGRWYGTGLGFGKKDEKKVDKLCDPQNSPKELIKYMLAQLVGGAAGTGVTILVYIGLFDQGQWPAPHVGPRSYTSLNGEHHTYLEQQAFFAEAFGTFLLCFVVLSVVSVEKPLQEYTAFCIGGCLVAAGYSFGPISGGLLNPAVTLAASIGDKFSTITSPSALLYLLAQFTGGALAAATFRFVSHPHEYKEASELTESMVTTA